MPQLQLIFNYQVLVTLLLGMDKVSQKEIFAVHMESVDLMKMDMIAWYSEIKFSTRQTMV